MSRRWCAALGPALVAMTTWVACAEGGASNDTTAAGVDGGAETADDARADIGVHDAAPEVADEILAEVSEDGTSEVSEDGTSEVSEDVAPEIDADPAPDVADAAPEVDAAPVPDVVEDTASEVAEDADVTPEDVDEVEIGDTETETPGLADAQPEVGDAADAGDGAEELGPDVPPDPPFTEVCAPTMTAVARLGVLARGENGQLLSEVTGWLQAARRTRTDAHGQPRHRFELRAEEGTIVALHSAGPLPLTPGETYWVVLRHEQATTLTAIWDTSDELVVFDYDRDSVNAPALDCGHLPCPRVELLEATECIGDPPGGGYCSTDDGVVLVEGVWESPAIRLAFDGQVHVQSARTEVELASGAVVRTPVSRRILYPPCDGKAFYEEATVNLQVDYLRTLVDGDRCRTCGGSSAPCPDGYHCDAFPRTCVADACAEVSCPEGESCRPWSGACEVTEPCPESTSCPGDGAGARFCDPYTDTCADALCTLFTPCDSGICSLYSGCLECLNDCNCRVGQTCLANSCVWSCGLAERGFTPDDAAGYDSFQVCIPKDDPEAAALVEFVSPGPVSCGHGGTYAPCDGATQVACIGMLDKAEGGGLSEETMRGLCDLRQLELASGLVGGNL